MLPDLQQVTTTPLYFKQSLISLCHPQKEVLDSLRAPLNGYLLTVANVLCAKDLLATILLD